MQAYFVNKKKYNINIQLKFLVNKILICEKKTEKLKKLNREKNQLKFLKNRTVLFRFYKPKTKLNPNRKKPERTQARSENK
jgi:hypothetical protein